jgi:excisionase family DNA binding protein
VTHAVFLREKARQLRVSKKLTIDELAARLSLSRSTIYYWVRDLPIPSSNPVGRWPDSAREKGSRAMQRKYRVLREHAYEEGRLSFGTLAVDPTFRDFVCLYIAEGFKRSRNRVSLCNSDPAVVAVAYRWIREFATNPLCYSIHFHADQEASVLTKFWGSYLDIDPKLIRLQRKLNSGQLGGRTWRCKHGVFSVGSNDTLLRARLEAWMDCLRASWA